MAPVMVGSSLYAIMTKLMRVCSGISWPPVEPAHRSSMGNHHPVYRCRSAVFRPTPVPARETCRSATLQYGETTGQPTAHGDLLMTTWLVWLQLKGDGGTEA